MHLWASLVAPSVKNLPAVQETRVRLLSQGGPLEKEMATTSTVLAQRIPWTEEPGGLQSMGSQELDTAKHIVHGILLVIPELRPCCLGLVQTPWVHGSL